ncbi:recombinase family protein [Ruminococcus sp.]|uniref:recombinase family protein n=1 Tax=Ruminococcus sp. TaxID=41978 RepID=UPI00345DA0AC
MYKASGKDTEREVYQYLKRQITRKGDTLVIKESDRLSRNNADIKRELEEFEEIISVKTRDIPTSLTDFPSEQAWVLAEVCCEKSLWKLCESLVSPSHTTTGYTTEYR